MRFLTTGFAGAAALVTLSLVATGLAACTFPVNSVGKVSVVVSQTGFGITQLQAEVFDTKSIPLQIVSCTCVLSSSSCCKMIASEAIPVNIPAGQVAIEHPNRALSSNVVSGKQNIDPSWFFVTSREADPACAKGFHGHGVVTQTISPCGMDSSCTTWAYSLTLDK